MILLPSPTNYCAIGRVFITDTKNDRICIYDRNLYYLYNVTSLSRPMDIKISRDHIYLLCRHNNPRIIVLTLEGEKLHSFITCREGKDVIDPISFCLDPLYEISHNKVYIK